MAKESFFQYYKDIKKLSIEEVKQRIIRGFIKGKLKVITFFNPCGNFICFLHEELDTWILGYRQPANYEINEKVYKLKKGGNINVK